MPSSSTSSTPSSTTIKSTTKTTKTIIKTSSIRNKRSVWRTVKSLFNRFELFLDNYHLKCRNPNQLQNLNKELESIRSRFRSIKRLDCLNTLFYEQMMLPNSDDENDPSNPNQTTATNLIKLNNLQGKYYFFGDLHGSLSDLSLIRSMFWKKLQQQQPTNKSNKSNKSNVKSSTSRTSTTTKTTTKINNNNQLNQSFKLPSNYHFIFLGDYVDRGIHGFEVIIYLLLLKCIYPKNFTLLRGNHEFIEMNSYSFLPELQLKFGLDLGKTIWSRINGNFSMLPYAALINNNIFCCHGGIPKHLRSMEQIERIPKGLFDIDDGTIEFQLVWNDFFSPNALASTEIEREPKNFVPNFTRGAGYIIGKRAVERFLKRFNLNVIVRAHDFTCCEKNGFDHLEVRNGSVFTIFSNSSYTNEPINNTAYLFIDIEQENMEIFPLVQKQFPDEYFNQSELIENLLELIEMKTKDPYSDLDSDLNNNNNNLNITNNLLDELSINQEQFFINNQDQDTTSSSSSTSSTSSSPSPISLPPIIITPKLRSRRRRSRS